MERSAGRKQTLAEIFDVYHIFSFHRSSGKRPAAASRIPLLAPIPVRTESLLKKRQLLKIRFGSALSGRTLLQKAFLRSPDDGTQMAEQKRRDRIVIFAVDESPLRRLVGIAVFIAVQTGIIGADVCELPR